MELKQVLSYLKEGTFTLEERNLITGALLDTLGAIPLTDILYSDEGLVVEGKQVDDMAVARNLRESAYSALSNRAFTLIREQVKYEAFIAAAKTAKDASELIFYRAALWWGEQVERKLQLLAQQTQEPDL